MLNIFHVLYTKTPLFLPLTFCVELTPTPLSPLLEFLKEFCLKEQPTLDQNYVMASSLNPNIVSSYNLKPMHML